MASRHLVVVPLSSLVLGGLAAPLAACDSCGCHAPAELNEFAPGLNLGLFEQYADFSRLKTDSERDSNPSNQWMQSAATQLIATWRFDERVAVSAFVPYLVRWYRRPIEHGMERSYEAGFGDASVLGTVRVYDAFDVDRAFRVSLQAGVKAPTGNANQLKSERDGGGDEAPGNAIGGHDLALGSGSWDPLIGGNAIGRIDRFYAIAGALYTIHTQGAYQYQFANELSATASLGWYLVHDLDDRVGLQVNAIVETKGLDTVRGEKTDDTANHDLYVGPELDFAWDRTFTALIAVDIPVIERESGTQLVPTWRGRAAIGWRF